jgi:hypothetical protein
MTENLNDYELKISFQASPKDAQAFVGAITQVLVAWERHERLRNITINLIDNPAEIE